MSSLLINGAKHSNVQFAPSPPAWYALELGHHIHANQFERTNTTDQLTSDQNLPRGKRQVYTPPTLPVMVAVSAAASTATAVPNPRASRSKQSSQAQRMYMWLHCKPWEPTTPPSVTCCNLPIIILRYLGKNSTVDLLIPTYICKYARV